MQIDGLESKISKYPKGSYFFKQGDFSRDLFVVRSGKVRIFKTVGVRAIMLEEMGKGSVFGEIAAIDGGNRSANAQAMVDTEAYVIDVREFKQRTANLPEWLTKIAKILVQRLRETDKHIEAENAGNHEYNGLLLLSYFVASEGKEEVGEAKSVDLGKIKRDLMDILRVRYATVSEIIDSLKEKSIIDIQENRLIVPDPEKLDEHIKHILYISLNHN